MGEGMLTMVTCAYERMDWEKECNRVNEIEQGAAATEDKTREKEKAHAIGFPER